MRSGTSDLPIEIVRAAEADAEELAIVAAQTFPLACPPSVSTENAAAFVAANLSPERFAEYLSDPRRTILAARADGRIIAYAMLIRDEDEVELSKMYVLADHHGGGTAAALMHKALATCGGHRVWLGVNQKNERAQRFYAKHGFTVAGTRTFRLGEHLEHDYVMAREP